MKVITTTEAHDQQQLLETAEYTTIKFIEHMGGSERVRDAMDSAATALPSWGAFSRLLGLFLALLVVFLMLRPWLRSWRRQKKHIQ